MALSIARLHGFNDIIRPLTVVVTDSDALNSANTTFTFSSQSLGTPDPERYMVLGCTGNGNAVTISSATIGGIAGTSLASQVDGTQHTRLFIAHVPTGTTGDVAITWSGSQSRTCFGLWAVYGLRTAAAFDTDTSTADPGTFSLSVPAYGCAIACIGTNSNFTFTWTGLTEDVENNANSAAFGGASQAFDAQNTALTVTGDASSATTTAAMVGASFAPY